MRWGRFVARTLENLIAEANFVFSGNFVLTEHQLKASTTRPIELLAQYVVAEMRDLYGPESSDQENLTRFIINLDTASARLTNVTRRFRELQGASPSKCAHVPPLHRHYTVGELGS